MRREHREGRILTVYEPRWHGFSKWTCEHRREVSDGWVESTPMYAGFVRRRGWSVVTHKIEGYVNRSRCREIARTL